MKSGRCGIFELYLLFSLSIFNPLLCYRGDVKKELIFLHVWDMADDIDRKHDLTHVNAEEYTKKIRYAEQLATLLCAICIEHCWDTESITECRSNRR